MSHLWKVPHKLGLGRRALCPIILPDHLALGRRSGKSPKRTLTPHCPSIEYRCLSSFELWEKNLCWVVAQIWRIEFRMLIHCVYLLLVNRRLISERNLAVFPNGENHTSRDLGDHQRSHRRVIALERSKNADGQVTA